MNIKTDLDLPPAYRTGANLWKAKYFSARLELIRANKGIYRLRRKLNKALQQPNAVDVKNPCCISFEETHPAFLYCGHCGTKLSRH